MSPFDPAGLKDRLEELDRQVENENFWSDQEKAQKVLKEKKSIENRLEEYADLEKELGDIEELIELADEEDDEEMASEILNEKVAIVFNVFGFANMNKFYVSSKLAAPC